MLICVPSVDDWVDGIYYIYTSPLSMLQSIRYPRRADWNAQKREVHRAQSARPPARFT